MNSNVVIIAVVGYFALLILISFLTGKNSDNDTFFKGNKSSKWYVVAFGMIGASLSGVTFISVPGWVEQSQFSYMQMVLGYFLGYVVIIKYLLPLYYKMDLTSIYQYLEQRFGFWAYKTGALYFLISRVLGASFRLFLVAGVFQMAISNFYGIPYWATVLITIILIWVYTFRSGIKTIVWTDTLQTFFMLFAVGITIYLIKETMNMSFLDMTSTLWNSSYSKVFFWDWKEATFFPKQFLAGAFIAIVMTGLDQDMMQKNLTCRTLKDAQKNMFGLSISLIVVNVLFLSLGALLYLYVDQNNITLEKGDALYTTLALHHLSPLVGLFFVLGVIAAAYSSADSALTSLTTSFCIDFLNFKSNKPSSEKIRILVHLGFSFLLFITILIFNLLNDDSVISKVFTAAGYTYGPLLGMFAFGIFNKKIVKDTYLILILCLISPILSYLLNMILLNFGFDIGFLILLLNGFLTYIGIYFISKVQ